MLRVFEFADAPPVMERKRSYRVTRWSTVSFLDAMCGVEPVPLDYAPLPEHLCPLIVPNINLRGFTQKDVDTVDDWHRACMLRRVDGPCPQWTITIGRYTMHRVFPIKMLDAGVAECCIDSFSIAP